MEDTRIIEAEPMVVDNTQNQTNSSSNEMSLGDLLSHARNTWLMPASRISRGEYLIASMPYSIITAVLTLLAYKTLGLTVYEIVSFVLALISLVMGLRLMAARLHDLNKSARNILWFVLTFLILIVLGGVVLTMLVSGGGFNPTNWMGGNNSTIVIVFGVLILIGFIGTLVIAIQLIFSKGTVGDNQYGSDPLLHQPVANTNYWILYIVGLIISFGISSLLPQSTNLANVGGMAGMAGMADTEIQNSMKDANLPSMTDDTMGNTTDKNLPMMTDDTMTDTGAVKITDDSGNLVNP